MHPLRAARRLPRDRAVDAQHPHRGAAYLRFRRLRAGGDRDARRIRPGASRRDVALAPLGGRRPWSGPIMDPTASEPTATRRLAPRLSAYYAAVFLIVGIKAPF